MSKSFAFAVSLSMSKVLEISGLLLYLVFVIAPQGNELYKARFSEILRDVWINFICCGQSCFDYVACLYIFD